jgi:hypothetical protein
MNDDHYLLQDYEAGNFPYYHRGLIDVSPYITNNSQVKQMVNTIALFDSPVLDFDVHCPIVYNKYYFKDCFYAWVWPEHGYGIKSTYCKKYSINGEQIEDLKFRERVFFKESIYKALENRPWFSIGDKVLMEGSKMIEVLNELYPNKSNYEL